MTAKPLSEEELAEVKTDYSYPDRTNLTVIWHDVYRLLATIDARDALIGELERLLRGVLDSLPRSGEVWHITLSTREAIALLLRLDEEAGLTTQEQRDVERAKP